MTVSRTSQLIVLTNDKSYRKKKTSLLIKNVGDETDDLLQPFFYAVRPRIPRYPIRIRKQKQETVLGCETSRPEMERWTRTPEGT